MKRSCFLTTVVFGTVLIGTVFYVIDKYGDDITLFFEDKVYEYTAESVDEYVSKIVKEEQKDTLEKIWNDAYDNAKQMKFDEGMKYLSTIITKIDSYSKDSLFTDSEINSIKELVQNETR